MHFQDHWSHVARHRNSLWFRGRTNKARSTCDNFHSDCPVIGVPSQRASASNVAHAEVHLAPPNRPLRPSA